MSDFINLSWLHDPADRPIKKILHGPLSKVIHRAWFVHEGRRPDYSDRTYARLMETLYFKKIAALKAFNRLEAPPINRLNFARVADCPAVACEQTGLSSVQFCRLTRWCPFCWYRTTAQAAINRMRDLNVPEQQDRYFILRWQDTAVHGPAMLSSAVREHTYARLHAYRNLANHHKVVTGGFATTRVAPIKDGWTVNTSLLLLAPNSAAGFRVPRTWEHVTDGTLSMRSDDMMRAVLPVCGYPRTLLKLRYLPQITEILNLHNVRLFATFGKLRAKGGLPEKSKKALPSLIPTSEYPDKESPLYVPILISDEEFEELDVLD